MTRIDLKDVLSRTVNTVYGDLVTRRTGEAVRFGIEAMLQDADETTVIDFGTVRLMDMSCADEIIGKLLLRQGTGRYFLLVGVHAAHEDALQPVLERHRLAVVAQDRTGALKLLGSLPEEARRAFGERQFAHLPNSLDNPCEHLKTRSAQEREKGDRTQDTG